MFQQAKDYILENKDKFTKSQITEKLVQSGYSAKVVDAAAAAVYPRVGKEQTYHVLRIIVYVVGIFLVLNFAAAGFQTKNLGCTMQEQAISIPQSLQDNYIRFEVPVYYIYHDKDYCGADFNSDPVIWSGANIAIFNESPQQFGRDNGSSEAEVNLSDTFKIVGAFKLVNTEQDPSVADKYTFLLLQDSSGMKSLIEYGDFALFGDQSQNQTSSAGIYDASGNRLGNVNLSN